MAIRNKILVHDLIIWIFQYLTSIFNRLVLFWFCFVVCWKNSFRKTKSLGDARHLDIAVADSIFRSQASDAKDRGLTYLQFTKAILAIADFVGVPHLRISQNVAGRAKVLSMSSTPMKYVVPKRQVDNALFYTTNMAKAAPAA